MTSHAARGTDAVPRSTEPIIFRRRCSGEISPVRRGLRVLASSAPYGWSGLLLEISHTHCWDADRMMFSGHYLGVNLSQHDLHFEIRNERNGWEPACLRPMSFLINPEGRPFSLRVDQEAYFAVCLIDAKFLDGVAGHHRLLNASSGVEDEVLAHLTRALVAVVREPGRHDRALADQLCRSFTYALAQRHGRPAGELSTRGGLAPHRLKSLRLWIDRNLEQPLCVDQLAARMEMSTAHFSREFKRSTGLTPWRYIVERRLDCARNQIEAGASVTAVALRLRFADQPHLSRLFKARYGISPSALPKAARTAGRARCIDAPGAAASSSRPGKPPVPACPGGRHRSA